MENEKFKKIDDFIVRLVKMKHEAGELGLWKTMHALEEPIKKVGFEVSDMIVKEKGEECPPGCRVKTGRVNDNYCSYHRKLLGSKA